MDFVKHTRWLVPLVLFGAVMSVPLLREPPQVGTSSQRENQSTNGKEQRAKDGAPTSPTFGQKNDQPDRPRNKEETAKAKQGNDDDSVKWTDEWIAKLTAALVLLALAQFVAAGLQARWTGKAVAVAKESADAASKSADIATRTAEIMEQNAERDLRAYVSLGNPKLVDVEVGKQPTVDVAILNTGRTPAQKVRVALTWFLGKEFDATVVRVAPVLPAASNAFIGVGQRIPTRVRLAGLTLTADQMTAIKEDRETIFVYGAITYDDTFRADRVTRFRFAYNHTNAARNEALLNVCAGGNGAD